MVSFRTWKLRANKLISRNHTELDTRLIQCVVYTGQPWMEFTRYGSTWTDGNISLFYESAPAKCSSTYYVICSTSQTQLYRLQYPEIHSQRNWGGQLPPGFCSIAAYLTFVVRLRRTTHHNHTHCRSNNHTGKLYRFPHPPTCGLTFPPFPCHVTVPRPNGSRWRGGLAKLFSFCFNIFGGIYVMLWPRTGCLYVDNRIGRD